VKIKKLYGVNGARKASGIVVIVDILRAASFEATALTCGAEKILPVGTKNKAIELKNKNPEYLIAGEEDGYKIDGFDLGNSPSELLKLDLNGKTIVHRSTQGTQGLINAVNADELIFGSFLTLSAIKNYILGKNVNLVSIVAMGGPGGEDDQFAFFLKKELNGNKQDIEKVKKYLKIHKDLSNYFDPNDDNFPLDDFEVCLDLDRFDFFCKVENKNGELITIKG